MGDDGAPPPRPIYARLERSRNASVPQERPRGGLPIIPPPPLRRPRWSEQPRPLSSPPAGYGSRGPRPPPPHYSRQDSRNVQRDGGPLPPRGRLQGPPPLRPSAPAPAGPKLPARAITSPSQGIGHAKIPPPPPPLHVSGGKPHSSGARASLPGPSHSAPLSFLSQFQSQGTKGSVADEREGEEGQLEIQGSSGPSLTLETRIEEKAELDDLRNMLSPVSDTSKRRRLGWGQGLAKMQTAHVPPTSKVETGSKTLAPGKAAPVKIEPGLNEHEEKKIKQERSQPAIRGLHRDSWHVVEGSNVLREECAERIDTSSKGVGLSHQKLPAVLRQPPDEPLKHKEQSPRVMQLDKKADSSPSSRSGHSAPQLITVKEVQMKALEEQQQNKQSLMSKIDKVDQQVLKLEVEIAELKKEETSLDEELTSVDKRISTLQRPAEKKLAILLQPEEDAAESRKRLVEEIWADNRARACSACKRVGTQPSSIPTETSINNYSTCRFPVLWRLKVEKHPDVALHARYEENHAKHQQLRPIFLKHLSSKRKELVDKRLALGLLYRKKWEHWQLLLAIRKAKNVSTIGGSKPFWDQRRTSSRFGGSSPNFAGVVRSEYEELQVIAQLQKSEQLKHLLKTPNMILERRERELCNFPSKNGLVRDPIKEREYEQRCRPWEEHEIRIFKDKYLLHTKDFRKIASFLPGRSSRDCVMFYYQNQKSEEFAHVRRKQQLKKRRLYSEAKKMSGTYMDVTANTGKNKSRDERLPPTAANRAAGNSGSANENKGKKDRAKGKKDVGMKDHGWQASELQSFLKAVKKHGKDFKAIATEMGSRSASAIKTFWALNKKSMALEKLATESQRSKTQVGTEKTKSPYALLRARGGLASVGAAKGWSKEDKDSFLKAFKQHGTSVLDIVECVPNKTEEEIRACLGEIDKLLQTQLSKASDAVKRTVSHWSQKEKDDFHVLYQEHGHDWKSISNILQTKSSVQVKNYFQSYKQKHGIATKKEVVSESSPLSKRPADTQADVSAMDVHEAKKQKQHKGVHSSKSAHPVQELSVTAPEPVRSASPTVNPATLATLYAGAQNPYLSQLAFSQTASMSGTHLPTTLPVASSVPWHVGNAQASAFSPVTSGAMFQHDCTNKEGPETAGALRVFGKTILPGQAGPLEHFPSRTSCSNEGGWNTGPMIPSEAAAAFSSMDPSLIAILQAAAAAQVAQFGGMNLFVPATHQHPLHNPVPEASGPAEDGAGPSDMEE